MNSNFNKLNFIITFFFVILLFLTSARIISHNNFPVVDHSHENFIKHHENLKRINLLQKENVHSKNLCIKVENKIVDRHHLRWVFEKLRINIVDLFGNNMNSNKARSIAFTLMISCLIICTFFVSILTVEKNLFILITKNKKNFLFLLFIFFFILAFYSFRFVSELRYSFFEMLFISTSLFSAYRKNYLLFLISIVMATLNRESGIIVASIWFIINGFNFKNYKIFIDKKQIIIGTVFIVAAILCLVSFNYKIFGCFFDLDFLSYKDSSYIPIINNNLVKNFNVVFSNFLIILFLMYYLYVDFNKQIKLILIILLYNIVFLVFTPPDHSILRIMFAPIFVLYAYEYLIHNDNRKKA